MFDIKTLLILIPGLPLAAALLTAVLGPRVLRARSHLPTVAALALSFVASMLLIFRVQERIEACAAEGGRTASIGFEDPVRWSRFGVGRILAVPSPSGRGLG